MMKTITFNELRKVKDSLPSGSMDAIAQELGIDPEEVRSYFGGKKANGAGFYRGRKRAVLFFPQPRNYQHGR